MALRAWRSTPRYTSVPPCTQTMWRVFVWLWFGMSDYVSSNGSTELRRLPLLVWDSTLAFAKSNWKIWASVADLQPEKYNSMPLEYGVVWCSCTACYMTRTSLRLVQNPSLCSPTACCLASTFSPPTPSVWKGKYPVSTDACGRGLRAPVTQAGAPRITGTFLEEQFNPFVISSRRASAISMWKRYEQGLEERKWPTKRTSVVEE
jgi:hypothetical protein